MDKTVKNVTETLINHELEMLEFRHQAFLELERCGVVVNGLVLERMEGPVHIAAWQKGKTAAHMSDVPITPAFVDSNYLVNPPLFNMGVVITWTELTSDGVYRSMYREFREDK